MNPEELGVGRSRWVPLRGFLDSTEPEDLPDDGPISPCEGAEGAHVMAHCAGHGAPRTGEPGRIEAGFSDDERDILKRMAEAAELSGRLDDAAGARAGTDEFESMASGSPVAVVARSGEFPDETIGSQRGTVDPKFNVEELKADEDVVRLMAGGNVKAAREVWRARSHRRSGG